jgi:hypothetical protein
LAFPSFQYLANNNCVMWLLVTGEGISNCSECDLEGAYL